MERKVQAVKEDSVKYEEEWRGEREREEERERQTQGRAKEAGVMKRQREEGSGRRVGRRKGLAGVPGAGTLSVALSASSHRGPVHTLMA